MVADTVVHLTNPTRELVRVFIRDGTARIYHAAARRAELLAEVVVNTWQLEGRTALLIAADGTRYEGTKARCACGSPLKRLNMESAWA